MPRGSTSRAAGLQRRADLLALHGHTYADAPVDAAICVYCGTSKGVGQDHVPPLSVLSWSRPGVSRLLYPACTCCNVKLSAYPSICLVARSEYLLCVLRREWLTIRGGNKRRWTLRQVTASGMGVKRRLAEGVTASLCPCRACSGLPVLLLTNPLSVVEPQGELMLVNERKSHVR